MTVDRALGRAIFLALVAILAIATCRDHREATAPGSQESANPKPPVGGPASDVSAETPPSIFVGAGDIASCGTDNDEATASLLDVIPGEVFTLGDNAYNNGTATEFSTCYERTWGRHKARTRPTLGDRDYNTTGAAGYSGYFGAAAGETGKFYYSYDLGDWHVVSLNSKLTSTQATAQLAWLKADLKASSRPCTIAYWHKPYLSSASGRDATRKPLWDMLYAYGAEIIMSADNRYYERFALQNPNEAADAAYGIRQFIVGTGGAAKSAAPTGRRAQSEVLNSGTPGVLKLTLGTGSYEWEFVPIEGMAFTDAGTGTCHGFPPPIANPGGPYKSEATVLFDGSRSSDAQDDPLTYAWDFGDGTTGTEAKPTHTYTGDGVYTVTLVVTDADGNASAPATTTATIANLGPTVEMFARTAPLGTANAPKLTFSDPGGAGDGPWTYRVDWGDGTSSTGTVNEQGTIVVSHVYPTIGKYLAVATVADNAGATGSDPANMTVTSPTGGTVVLAAGDVAKCNVTGGADNDELTAQILLAHPTATVFTLGDNAYPDGTASDYTNCYTPTWGRPEILSRTYAALGNHEYDVSPTPTFNYFGARAGAPGTHPSCTPGVTPRGVAYNCEGYYSVDLGEWHIVVLNDNIPIGSSSGQLAWLRDVDLVNNTKKCQIVIWHQPRFFSTDERLTSTPDPDDWFFVRVTRKAIWDRLYPAGVELALNAHQHFYERFHPMNPDGVRDELAGIRQFMVGTGGESTKDPASLPFIAPNSAARSGDFGVLKLTLHPNAYEWEFIPASGFTFKDSGSGVCR